MTIRVQNLDIESYAAVMAIGDIHGSFAKLKRLVEKFRSLANPGDRQAVICLGDLVDRGPHSCAVLDWLLQPQAGLDKFSVLGNHEAMMLSFLTKPKKTHEWLQFGGLDALKSYGINPDIVGKGLFPNFGPIQQSVPAPHIDYLAALPHVITMGKIKFFHAGYDCTVDLAAQDPQRLLWGPLALPAENPDGQVLVHGHQIVATPQDDNRVINIDTGAYQGGALTGLIFSQVHQPQLIQTI